MPFPCLKCGRALYGNNWAQHIEQLCSDCALEAASFYGPPWVHKEYGSWNYDEGFWALIPAEVRLEGWYKLNPAAVDFWLNQLPPKELAKADPLGFERGPFLLISGWK